MSPKTEILENYHNDKAFLFSNRNARHSVFPGERQKGLFADACHNRTLHSRNIVILLLYLSSR